MTGLLATTFRKGDIQVQVTTRRSLMQGSRMKTTTCCKCLRCGVSLLDSLVSEGYKMLIFTNRKENYVASIYQTRVVYAI